MESILNYSIKLAMSVNGITPETICKDLSLRKANFEKFLQGSWAYKPAQLDRIICYLDLKIVQNKK